MHEIHSKLKQERSSKIEKEIEELEKTKDDSTKMFKAIRISNREKKKSI